MIIPNGQITQKKIFLSFLLGWMISECIFFCDALSCCTSEIVWISAFQCYQIKLLWRKKLYIIINKYKKDGSGSSLFFYLFWKLSHFFNVPPIRRKCETIKNTVGTLQWILSKTCVVQKGWVCLEKQLSLKNWTFLVLMTKYWCPYDNDAYSDFCCSVSFKKKMINEKFERI